MDEHVFQRKSDAAFESLRKRLLEIGDQHDFEVEGGAGKLEIEFDDEATAQSYKPPHFVTREITSESSFSGVSLAEAERP